MYQQTPLSSLQFIFTFVFPAWSDSLDGTVHTVQKPLSSACGTFVTAVTNKHLAHFKKPYPALPPCEMGDQAILLGGMVQLLI